MKHVESKLFNQNGHFYFSFQIYIYICLQCNLDFRCFTLFDVFLSEKFDKVFHREHVLLVHI